MSAGEASLFTMLPRGWFATPLRYATTCLDGRRVPLNTDERGRCKGDYPYWGANGVLDTVDDYIFDEPLVLLGEDGAPFFDKSKAVAFLVDGKIWVNNHIHVLRISPKFEPRFVVHALNATNYVPWVDGSTRDKLTQEKMGDIPLPTPELAIQRAIADYLDRETTRLDALVAAKERLLGLLAEKRRALITRAVTRGLDPRAPLRDTGIQWLGEIPAHWRVGRLRFLSQRIEQGWSPQAENREPSHDEWGVIKLNAVNQGRFDDTAAKALPEDVGPAADLEVRAGDFLVTRSNTPTLVGDACFVETTRPHLMLCDLVYRLALRTDLIDGLFLGHFLTVPAGRRQIVCDARGTSASMVKISQEHIKDWLIPLPPVDEQKQIVRHLAQKLAPIQRIQTATERTIVLLKERRAALIAAAVTGQIDLGAAA